MKRLLVVFHSRSGTTQRLADAVIKGARDPAIAGVEVVVKDALVATPEDVRACDAIIVGTPENFGYMSGAIKMFFENIYYACLDHTQGLPYALFIRAGNDGTGALSSMQRIITGLRWREVAEPTMVAQDIKAEDIEHCLDLGMALAAGLEGGIF